MPGLWAGIVAGGLSIVGVTGSLAVLPHHGLELLFFGIGTAVLAVHWTVEGIRGGDIRGCPIDPPERGGPGG